MSLFVPKEWKDRLAEFAGRRKLTNISTGEETTVDVSRAEGEVSQEGHAFSAANMNDLEQRIKDGFDKVDSDLANGQISFDVVDGEPYVKVGADTPRPFSNSSTGIYESDGTAKEITVPFTIRELFVTLGYTDVAYYNKDISTTQIKVDGQVQNIGENTMIRSVSGNTFIVYPYSGYTVTWYAFR